MILLSNHDRKLIEALTLCLQNCIDCKIAVAYVRSSGINSIYADIEQVVKRGGKVKLLTSNQMGITEPEAIKSLLEIGVEIKAFINPDKTFHPKAYIFIGKKKTEYIIGSSNLSRSALINGIEWNLYFDDFEPNTPLIENEFDRIWHLEKNQNINKENVTMLFKQHIKDDFAKFIKNEDTIPTSSNTLQKILDNSTCYPVTKRPDDTNTWKFNLSVNKTEVLLRENTFFVVVRCDYESPNEIIFAIPSEYLKRNIFPYANQSNSKRYLFEVNKGTLQFNWQRSIKMDGKPFLIPK